MTKDTKTVSEISDADLDKVQGGATAYIGETEKNLSGKLKPKSSPDNLRDGNLRGASGLTATSGGSSI